MMVYNDNNPYGDMCPQCGCSPCACGVCVVQDTCSFSFTKVDQATGRGLPNSVWRLRAPDGTDRTGVSDQNGVVQFGVRPGVAYILTEVTPPPGYIPIIQSLQVSADGCGCIVVNGQRMQQFILPNVKAAVTGSFTAIKVNGETGLPLSGAGFTLTRGPQVIASAISTDTGAVSFADLPPGTYRLEETSPLPGFIPLETLTVVVAENGSVTIAGQPAQGFQLENTPAPSFSFVKVDGQTQTGLAGATFQLFSGGVPAATAVSDATGGVSFNAILPGMYQLVETQPPAGFAPNPQVYTVVVAADGTVTIDGGSPEDFVVEDLPVIISPTPVIDSVFAGDAAINGSGSPGCAVDVTFPGGQQASTTVLGDGSWSVTLPGGVTLAPGNQITAVQTCAGAQPSVPVVAIVQQMLVDYTINYYRDSIDPANLLGIVSGAGVLGSAIGADLTLFAPLGYQVPGTRSGALAITPNPGDNVVNVVYTEALLSWYVDYYVSNLLPEDFIGRVAMPPVAAGTVITLTPAQLDAYRPVGYAEGVQVGGPVAIVADGQIIQVVYVPI